MIFEILMTILIWMAVLFGILVFTLVWTAAITFSYKVASDFYKAFKEAPEVGEEDRGEELD